MMSPCNISANLKSVFVKPPSWIVVELYYSLLIELTFKGLRNFAAERILQTGSRPTIAKNIVIVILLTRVKNPVKSIRIFRIRIRSSKIL